MEDLLGKVIDWWNPMTPYDREYYVKLHERGCVPVAALTEGAIIRLYLKAVEGLTYQQALQKYHTLLNNKSL